MDDLLVCLLEQGWELDRQKKSHPEYEDPFLLVDDSVIWQITRRNTEFSLKLKFQAFDYMGRRTQRLRDISYCVVSGQTAELPFLKRSHPEWLKNVRRFVLELAQIYENSRPPRRPPCPED